jgi:hypothetical protein
MSNYKYFKLQLQQEVPSCCKWKLSIWTRTGISGPNGNGLKYLEFDNNEISNPKMDHFCTIHLGPFFKDNIFNFWDQGQNTMGI